ncbi:zinc finger protein 385D isoform X3 [Onychostoma macrolepis]|uniref:zinc finger protein 385D isoform X3 n=1 Tax=Onychostoma macrolepis TaxID=369639 RepID=UPI00272D6900|nr:zinc finger protein 385D isoform X3 [Onychostoma macrolepis]XP_058603998.1 zinc finger protein 385D isoform X3 [Onychostoma macrolepis]XP_058603999.1 zinc finger protein 385D isoform X3 [Onychostoma macrolepis]XP_058604000.1 zinc finger protein 385D isoform X3 [Onychostoma macrolepis]XP_058604001.1 zinc finger protein 385D isoform X3 [Onychostoma macrolepis]XP_058604002.1 zinc finger protein 385D isoform X3 [Onychostoma macrolepis]XP_058604003.1 zinc finger protein 385D isoform X3 [Onychos
MATDTERGNACQSGLVPALVRATLPTVQTSLGMKHFLPFPLDGGSTLRFIPSFSSMDPVQKAVLHHTFSTSSSSRRKAVSCGVCQLRFNSQSQALAHYKGTKHAKKLKSLDTPKCLKHKSSLVTRENTNKEPPRGLSPSTAASNTDRKGGSPGAPVAPSSPSFAQGSGPGVEPTEPESTSVSGGEDGRSITPTLPEPEENDPEVSPEAEAETETEDEKALRLLYCSLCKVAVNSASQLDAHNSGTKHKTMLEARSGNGSIKSFPRAGLKSKLAAPTKADTGLQNKTFHCETCDVRVNSETQLKQHISSRRHKDRAAGKPAKPKFSPYTKTQRGATKQTQVKMSAGKDLCPPLTTRIMPSHLAAVAAAAAAVGSAFPLRACHNPALFQTQSLPAALLRPAPGPIRTAHTPVLFAPY